MRLHLMTCLGFAALLLGCEGGQSGDLSGNNDGGGETNSGGYCEEHRKKLGGFEEDTELGTPAAALGFAEGEFEAPLTWSTPRENQPWQVGPESGESSIHLQVERGDNAYYITYTPKQSDSGEELGIGCPEPELGVDAHVTVTTEGGALDEGFDVVLRSGAPGLAQLSVPLELDELHGSLDVTYSDPKVELVQVRLNATLMPEGMTGSIAGIEQTDQGAAVSAGQALLAVWPDSAACSSENGDRSGLGVAPDQDAFGISGDAAGELLAATTPAAIQWRDGSETELTLSVSVDGDGCLRASQYAFEEASRGEATYPAHFTVTSADGRLQGEYAGKLVTRPSGDGNAVSAEAVVQLALAQAAESGFAELEVPDDVERLAVWLKVSVEDGVTQGSLVVNGLTDPPCVTEPAEPMPQPGGGSSVPGCEGTHVTVLESAEWGE